MAYMASPISRAKLRRIADVIREGLGYAKDRYLPIVDIVEFDLVRLYPDYQFIVVPVNELGETHGETDMQSNTIYIREDIYERAIRGEGRDRMTIAHEVAHLVLHKTFRLQRVEPGTKVVTYRQPEWQANALAGELLVPFSLVKCLNPAEIAKECGVSLEAAKYQHSRFKL